MTLGEPRSEDSEFVIVYNELYIVLNMRFPLPPPLFFFFSIFPSSSVSNWWTPFIWYLFFALMVTVYLECSRGFIVVLLYAALG